MFRFWLMGPLMEGEPGAGGGDGGTGSGEPPQYVTVKDFGAAAGKIRGVEKTLTDLAAKALTRDALLDVFAEIGIGEKAEDGTFKLKFGATDDKKKKAAGDGGGSGSDDNPVLTSLQRKLEALERTNREKDDLIATEREATKKAKIRSVIEGALSKAGAVKPQRDAVHISGAVLNEDGSVVVPSKDKFGNEIEVSIDDYAAAWLEENPELKRAVNQGGSGTSGSTSGGGAAKNGKGQVIPYAQWNDMNWFSKNHAKFQSGEYVRSYDKTR